METTNINFSEDNKKEFIYQEFFIFKDNNIYKIVILKNKTKILNIIRELSL